MRTERNDLELIFNPIGFEIDLFLFTEEKTEPATPKRRREAREKGQIPKSRELVTALLLIVVFWSIKTFANWIFGDLMRVVQDGFVFPKDLDSEFTIVNMTVISFKKILAFGKIMAPILAAAVLVSLIANYMQVGVIFTIKPLTPNLNKLNPLEGFKRLFSRNASVEFLKSLFKIVIIGYFIYDYLFKNYIVIPDLIGMDLKQTSQYIADALYNIGIRAGVVLFILAVFDFTFQYFEHERTLKMTKQEIKDEYKQTEGNPQIKGRIREKQRAMAMKRMMSEVPKADVIITNPTHFAIAIKYDAEVSEAPLVIAKGKDLIAKQIREKALEHKIPIVENPPLAQTLFKTVEIGQSIPSDLYKAVAEVLAYVYNLKKK